ncbi:phosphate ABC transporter substrate-binding protein [Mycolicibacterium mageritense DSM 44476 = CIP 104973]|uniref:Phosphate-binding protein n=1 Tax=Mycolicibacterium mageritense TaxID=53462 RepID=A0AAI8TQS6_MYCME|nr:phosphate ABC transporter substrate-binding protein PstS [Mycolicibacterium mageritense]MBN3455118.1 phosphate ABC transporter substrate-binding protein PstS [Mycobacterium sp. DSM 3803]OKH70387.1 phosphate-binding protein [Mycobacterium sp. SWH-M3]MCC9182115.1 phosphate ABC transporter substrate-binding protein PstS [Mycolicibacterium mageritense]TXI59110.1 MAG: phosphate ABC transporter substrate-binding protein PstS [Mycolicibacterium mageritense]CDO23469.1 phosphate ABC transporter subs
MKLNSIGKTVGTALSATAIAALTLTACGSDNNAGTASSSAASGSAAASAECGGKSAVTAEGSTAQQNAIAEFNKAWGQACSGKNLSYNPTGSGAGREQFIAKQVDFAGSDSALKGDQVKAAADRCGGNPAWNLPLVFGPVAMAYNLEGVDKLVVNGEVLAKIFQGQITKWNDPAIAALNAGTTLPDVDIKPIYRSDSSGTTDNFQKYLAAAAPQAWTKGDGSEFNGGAGEGAQKSSGVVQAVQATPGAIGYVEKGFAEQAKLPFAQIDSGAGAVELTDESAAKAIDAAKFAAEGNDLALDLKSLYGTKEAGAYPLVLATYEIVCSKGYDADTAAAVKSFLTVAANQGQANLSAAGYVPLPDTFKERLVTSINAIS